MSLHPRIAAALAAAAGVPAYHTLPVAQARTMARAGYLKDAPPFPVQAVRDLEMPGPQGALSLRLYTPPGVGPHPVVMFFHGSGFVMLDLDTHDDICRRLCAGGLCVVVSVDYRLAPEHPFPAAPDDCLAATRWVALHTRELAVDATRMVVCGDSAGGCLAVVTALRSRDEGGPPLAGQLLFYPVLDVPSAHPDSSYGRYGTGFGLSRDGMAWFWDQYLPDPRQRLHPYAAPLRAASVAGLPAAHVEVAEYDVLRDEGAAYVRRLADAGIAATLQVAEGMNHGFLKYAGELAEADATLSRACAWLRAVWERPQPQAGEGSFLK